MPSEKSWVFHSQSEQETIAIGERLARELRPGDVVLLIGELGAGKTTLAKGIVKGLGVANPEEVASPTFTLVHEYGEPPAVYHVDLYRIDTPAELETIGLDEVVRSDAVILVEWGERLRGLLREPYWVIELSRAAEDVREIRVSYTGTAAPTVASDSG